MAHARLTSLAIACLLTLLGAALSLQAGSQLRSEAKSQWLRHARQDVARASDTIYSSVEQSLAILRAYAALFQGSEEVTWLEFAETARLTQGWDAEIPYLALAFAPRVTRDSRADWESRLGTAFSTIGSESETSPIGYESFPVFHLMQEGDHLERGNDLVTVPEFETVVETAFRLPDQVILGPTISHEDGGLHALAGIAAPNGTSQGVLVALLTFTDLLSPHSSRQVPDGLSLRFAERDSEGRAETAYRPIIGDLAAPAGVVSTIPIRMTHGQARWELYWDVLPSYDGGPNYDRARSVEYGGSILSLVASAILLILLLQNIRVRELVRKRTLELETSEARLSAILENAPAEIYLKDTEGRYVLVNRHYEKNWGVTNRGVLGKRPTEIHDQKDFGEASRAHDLAVLRSGAMQEREHEVLMNGEPRTLHVIKFPIRDEQGQTTGLGAIAFDVSEQKKAERGMLASMEEARMANRAKSEFLANMSHELRTPLNAIIGFSQIIQQDTFKIGGAEKYREYAGDIHQAGSHLLELVNDLLDLAKIEAKSERLSEEATDVLEIARSVHSLVKVRAETVGVELELRAPEDLPALLVDARKLRQILINLLTNAIKFTKEGGAIVLEISRRNDEGHVFRLTDSGIGMGAEDIPLALTPFGQIDSSLSRDREGTGLGLPLAKSLVEAHGGTLELESEPGVGTTVTLRFPASRVVASPEATAARDPESRRGIAS